MVCFRARQGERGVAACDEAGRHPVVAVAGGQDRLGIVAGDHTGGERVVAVAGVGDKLGVAGQRQGAVDGIVAFPGGDDRLRIAAVVQIGGEAVVAIAGIDGHPGVFGRMDAGVQGVVAVPGVDVHHIVIADIHIGGEGIVSVAGIDASRGDIPVDHDGVVAVAARDVPAIAAGQGHDGVVAVAAREARTRDADENVIPGGFVAGGVGGNGQVARGILVDFNVTGELVGLRCFVVGAEDGEQITVLGGFLVGAVRGGRVLGDADFTAGVRGQQRDVLGGDVSEPIGCDQPGIRVDTGRAGARHVFCGCGQGLADLGDIDQIRGRGGRFCGGIVNALVLGAADRTRGQIHGAGGKIDGVALDGRVDRHGRGGIRPGRSHGGRGMRGLHQG